MCAQRHLPLEPLILQRAGSTPDLPTDSTRASATPHAPSLPQRLHSLEAARSNKQHPKIESKPFSVIPVPWRDVACAIDCPIAILGWTLSCKMQGLSQESVVFARAEYLQYPKDLASTCLLSTRLPPIWQSGGPCYAAAKGFRLKLIAWSWCIFVYFRLLSARACA